MHTAFGSTLTPNALAIRGGVPLRGSVTISGRKNSISALLSAALLTASPTVIENVPDIDEVSRYGTMLEFLGAEVSSLPGGRLRIDPSRVRSRAISPELGGMLRSSYYLLGVQLARFSRAAVCLPGGDKIGARPVDQHIKGLRAMGADVRIEGGMMLACASRLRPARIHLDLPSVGATIHLLLTAAGVPGVTEIHNAAREPHVVDVATLLHRMGARVVGAGTSVIHIEGRHDLRGVDGHAVIPDDLEAATWMAAAVVTRGDVTLQNLIPEHLSSLISKLVEAGVTVEEGDTTVRVRVQGDLQPLHLRTQAYPGFPTDAQPQFTAWLVTVPGTSVVEDTIYDDRFRFSEGLREMGATIWHDSHKMVVQGVPMLAGADVTGDDIRGVAALAVSAMGARGWSMVRGVHHLRRGYSNFVEKAWALGADITWKALP